MTHVSAADDAQEPPVPAEEGAGPTAGRHPWTAQMDALGGYIRTQRQLARLSLREMANMTQISNAYLSQVERGLHQPSLKVLHSIADALHLSAEQLLDHAGWAPAEGAGPGPGAGLDAHLSSDTANASATTAAPGPPPPGDTEAAIMSDPRLSESQRDALIGVYRSFVGPPGAME
jgi:transcriptional regulator with XRE-family HTH domain